MASPRELELGVLAPLAPNFPRKLSPGVPTLEKFSGVEDLYDDINRQPTANPSPSAGIALAMDVPVVMRRQRYVLTNAVVTLAAADDFGSLKICDLPDRNIAIWNAELVGSVNFGGDYADGDDPSIGVGQAAASNVTLSSTMVDVIPKTDFANITVANSNAIAATKSNPGVAVLVADAAGNALYLNVGNGADQLSDVGTATFNGTLDIWYTDLGNVGS